MSIAALQDLYQSPNYIGESLISPLRAYHQFGMETLHTTPATLLFVFIIAQGIHCFGKTISPDFLATRLLITAFLGLMYNSPETLIKVTIFAATFWALYPLLGVLALVGLTCKTIDYFCLRSHSEEGERPLN